MISNTSLQSFSVPTRSAAVSGPAASSGQTDGKGRADQTANGTGRGDTPAMAMSGTRGTLLDRWA